MLPLQSSRKTRTEKVSIRFGNVGIHRRDGVGDRWPWMGQSTRNKDVCPLTALNCQLLWLSSQMPPGQGQGQEATLVPSVNERAG